MTEETIFEQDARKVFKRYIIRTVIAALIGLVLLFLITLWIPIISIGNDTVLYLYVSSLILAVIIFIILSVLPIRKKYTSLIRQIQGMSKEESLKLNDEAKRQNKQYDAFYMLNDRMYLSEHFMFIPWSDIKEIELNYKTTYIRIFFNLITFYPNGKTISFFRVFSNSGKKYKVELNGLPPFGAFSKELYSYMKAVGNKSGEVTMIDKHQL